MVRDGLELMYALNNGNSLFEDINDFNLGIKVTLLYIEFLLAYF